jgi:hypothetical protein
MVRKGRCGAAGGRTSGRQRGPVPEDDVVNLDHVRVLQLDGNVQLSLERVLPCGVHCKQREWLSQKMRSATQTRRQDRLQYEAWYVSCLSRTLPRPVHRLDRDLPAVRCVNGCVDTDAARTLAQLWTVQQLCSSQITTRTRSASKQGATPQLSPTSTTDARLALISRYCPTQNPASILHPAGKAPTPPLPSTNSAFPNHAKQHAAQQR